MADGCFDRPSINATQSRIAILNTSLLAPGFQQVLLASALQRLYAPETSSLFFP